MIHIAKCPLYQEGAERLRVLATFPGRVNSRSDELSRTYRTGPEVIEKDRIDEAFMHCPLRASSSPNSLGWKTAQDGYSRRLRPPFPGKKLNAIYDLGLILLES